MSSTPIRVDNRLLQELDAHASARGVSSRVMLEFILQESLGVKVAPPTRQKPRKLTDPS